MRCEMDRPCALVPAGVLMTTRDELQQWRDEAAKYNRLSLERLTLLDRAIAEVKRLTPCVIETVEELDALPVGSVVRTSEGRVAEVVRKDRSRGWWIETGEKIFLWAVDLGDFPATVLYTPEGDE